MDFRIAIVRGDGIGPEVIDAAVPVLDRVGRVFGHRFRYEYLLAGGAALDGTGEPLPKETLEQCRSSDAVLLGAVGDPKWDSLPGDRRPEAAILGLRESLGLFANLRPAVVYSELEYACPLKPEIAGDGLDILIVRELTGGIYFGKRGTEVIGRASGSGGLADILRGTEAVGGVPVPGGPADILRGTEAVGEASVRGVSADILRGTEAVGGVPVPGGSADILRGTEAVGRASVPDGFADILRGEKALPPGRFAYDVEQYTEFEIRRIAHVAFGMAMKRDRHVTSVDKANVLESSRLWRTVMEEVGAEYPDVRLDHMYVDNAAQQLIRDPKQFDVIATSNMFGDILSDEASQITGSIGMLPSASLGEGSLGLFEPIHGSAPKYAGMDTANPIATILSAAMLLRYSLNLGAEADAVENAVRAFLAAGYRTRDTMADGKTPVGTQECGRLIAGLISN